MDEKGKAKRTFLENNIAEEDSGSSLVASERSTEGLRYEPRDNLKMLVGTWNVGGNSPDEGLQLKDWLRTSENPDIYVLGFQEIVPLSVGNVLGMKNKSSAAKWLSIIGHALNNTDYCHNTNNIKLKQSQHVSPDSCFSDLLSSDDQDSQGSISFGSSSSSRLSSSSSEIEGPLVSPINGSVKNEKYCLLSSKQMVGVFLCVWVRNDLHKHITRLNVSRVGTGIMGYLGNKGSVSISMTLHQTAFCFVCTHLASGEREGDEVRRNRDVKQILKKTRFSHSLKRPRKEESIMKHEKIIWLGDLNYRLASGYENTQELLMKKDWQALLKSDQLRVERRASRVFQGWEEGRISFAPTYKYIPNSGSYAYQRSTLDEKRRTPAWCDRILWRGKGLKQMSYARAECKFSDHRPVYSLFSVQVEMANNSSISKSITSNTWSG